MKPRFEPGQNIAIKVPPHQFEQTVSFYRDILGLEQLHLATSDKMGSVTFKFGDKNLWIDKVGSISQAEIWLDIKTNDIEAAARYLHENNVTRRDEIEPLPPELNGFWISSPASIIHLVEASSSAQGQHHDSR